MKKSFLTATAVLAVVGTLFFFAGCKKEKPVEKKTGGFRIAESTIYLTPTWQQDMKNYMETRVAKYKAEGIVSEFAAFNANGDTSTQISQIENLIAQKWDAIIVDAGSSTALNTVIEKAHEAGIVVINPDSLVTTDELTSRIGTRDADFGAGNARFVAEKIGGKGNVIIFNGPKGVAVAEARRQGILDELKKYPDIKILTELYSEYNEGPALDAIRPALDANANVDGIIATGGALASAALKSLQTKNMKLVPIAGENYGAFLKNWAASRKDGFSGYAVGQPTWLGTLAVEQAVRALTGKPVKLEVFIPLPEVTDDNIDSLDLSSIPDDGFAFTALTEAQIDEMLR